MSISSADISDKICLNYLVAIIASTDISLHLGKSTLNKKIGGLEKKRKIGITFQANALILEPLKYGGN